MARLRKKRIRWEPPDNTAGLTYRLYWAAGESVGYESQFIELEDVTEVTLPDGVTPFMIKGGNIQIGISAINEAGNESDIARLDVLLDFSIPEAPNKLQILDPDTAGKPKHLLKVTLASIGIVLLAGIGVLALLTLGDWGSSRFVEPRQQDHAVVTNGGAKVEAEKPPTSVAPVPPVSRESQGLNSQSRSGGDLLASGLKVEAIVWSIDRANSFAYINGREVKVGDIIEGAMVTEIGKDYVAFKSGDSKFRITMR